MMTVTLYQEKKPNTILALLYRKHVAPPTCHFVLRLIIVSVIPKTLARAPLCHHANIVLNGDLGRRYETNVALARLNHQSGESFHFLNCSASVVFALGKCLLCIRRFKAVFLCLN